MASSDREELIKRGVARLAKHNSDVPLEWIERAVELLRDPDPAWKERGAEILRGEL